MSDFDSGSFCFNNSDEVNPYPGTTVCNGQTQGNIFWRRGAPGYPGQCILDQMDFEQLISVLQRVPNAAEHLRRITNDPKLLQLANEVPLISPESDELQKSAKLINHGIPGANTLPYYTVIRGNSGGDII